MTADPKDGRSETAAFEAFTNAEVVSPTVLRNYGLGLIHDLATARELNRQLSEQVEAAKRDALHEAAQQIEDYLRKEHAAPMWWHVYDIVHEVAGCTWSHAYGDDGEYDCRAALGLET